MHRLNLIARLNRMDGRALPGRYPATQKQETTVGNSTASGAVADVGRGTALLPCPFCGKPPVSFKSGHSDGLMIECPTPGCVNPHVSTIPPSFAIAAWNLRAAPANPPTAKG